MSTQQKEQITALFKDALAPLLDGSDLAVPVITLERPRDLAHGDFACNIAMQLAKQLKMNPRELATQVVAALLASPANGFITGANYRVDGGQTRGLN